MWFVLVALAFASGVSGRYRICERVAEIECVDKHMQRATSLPETKDEKENACSNIDKITHCVTEFEKNCTEEFVRAYDRDMFRGDEEELYYKLRFFDDLKEICKRQAYFNSAEFREKVCESRAYSKCRAHAALPNELPGTDEELEKACQNLYGIKQCLSDSSKECLESTESLDEDDERTLYSSSNMEFGKRLVDVLSEICDEDADLHKEFVPKLACYKWMLEQEQDNEESQCDKHVQNSLEYLQLRIERKATSGGQQPLSSEYSRCLRQILTFNCFALKSGKFCGHRASEVLQEIFQRVVDLNYICPKRILLDVMELMDDLEMLTKTKLLTKNLLPKATQF